jgi:lipopolysaccharide heptosyltransferase II
MMKLSGLKKILILRLSSFGDVLLTTPLIRSIRKNYPNIKIDFVVREEYTDILKHNPNINKIYSYAESQYERHSLMNSLIAEDYDLLLDLQNNIRSREIIRPLRCEVIKFRKKNLDKFLLVNFKINRLKEAPPIPVRYAEIIEDFKLDNEGLEIFTDKKPNKLLQQNKTYIGLCPGAKHFTKRWPEEYFIKLGKLLEQNDYNVALFGGLNDIKLCAVISNQLRNAINLCNKNDLLQTAADMKYCSLIYCNDSGLMHLASAVKVPVIAFFGSTVKEFGFSPYKANSIVLEVESLRCRPCTHIGRKNCPKKHFKCLKDITPEMAFANLNKLIKA